MWFDVSANIYQACFFCNRRNWSISIFASFVSRATAMRRNLFISPVFTALFAALFCGRSIRVFRSNQPRCASSQPIIQVTGPGRRVSRAITSSRLVSCELIAPISPAASFYVTPRYSAPFYPGSLRSLQRACPFSSRLPFLVTKNPAGPSHVSRRPTIRQAFMQIRRLFLCAVT